MSCTFDVVGSCGSDSRGCGENEMKLVVFGQLILPLLPTPKFPSFPQPLSEAKMYLCVDIVSADIDCGDIVVLMCACACKRRQCVTAMPDCVKVGQSKRKSR